MLSEKLSDAEGQWSPTENEWGKSSLMSGLVLGYSCHPHSIINYEKTLAKTNMDEIRKKIHIKKTVTDRVLRARESARKS